MASLVLNCCSKYGALMNTSHTRIIDEGFERSGTRILDRFFDENTQAPQSESAEPPQKRQRLDTDVGGDESQYASSVPIARITVNLATMEDLNERDGVEQPTVQFLEDVIDFNLLKAEQNREKPIRRIGNQPRPPFEPCPVRLGLLGKKGIYLNLELSSSIDEAAFVILSTIASIERGNKIKRRGVTQPQCRLFRSSSPTGSSYKLEFTILWLDGESAYGPLAVNGRDDGILRRFCPEPGVEVNHEYKTPGWSYQRQKWDLTPQEFYDSVHSPAADIPLPDALNARVLETELYPFQKRAVAWMLDREMLKERAEQFTFSKSKDVVGNECFVSHLHGVVSSKPDLEFLSEPRGGILAEEMGLGKTCELIALLILNPRRFPYKSELQGSNAGQNPISTGATLIVTPHTILQQWKDEINKHAPGLSVMHYTGMTAASKWKKDESRVLHDFATKDVVLTTYSVLAKEVHFAVDPPDRSLRQRGPKRERIRSPLVRMHWWRVCLDEAQMVESGVSAAARVAALLPRENAWGVSGTPLKKDIEDLFGLLIFLRYQPFCDSVTIWRRLITQYKHEFKTLFGRIALRQTKDQIRNELSLPLQRRVVLTMSFTAIEEQNYKTLFEEMCKDLGYKTDGSPAIDGLDPDRLEFTEKMRSWLVRLRQTCLHPQVGSRNRRALGRGAAPLRTVTEVLEVMIDQNETAVRTEARLTISSLLLKAHIISNAKDDENRSRTALEIYKEALQQAEEIVSECRANLAKLGVIGDALRLAEEADDEEDYKKTPEHAARLRSRQTLHSALQMQHACAFFVGTACFQIKSNEAITEPDSVDFVNLEAEETTYYDIAKAIRKELLRETSTKAESLMEKVETRKDSKVKSSTLSSLDSLGGIENTRIVSRADDLADLFDAQAKLINEWETKVVELLLKPLVDEDEGIETTGDEYEDSTKQQDTLYAYSDALRAIVADRNTCITGQSAPLIDHEMNVLIREAREGKGHDPELILKLLSQRNKLKQRPDETLSLRGLIHESRGLETSLQGQDGNSTRASAEVYILQQQTKALGKIYSNEMKVMTDLEKGLELFRSTMNGRLEFYRQLQYISDTVAPYKEDLDETLDRGALNDAISLHESKARTLAQLKTKQRFLLHLSEESSNASDAERTCVICQCGFEQGVLTVCGHQYCKECIHHWWKAHKTCPVCKRRLNSADFHNITYKPQELRAQEETHSNSESGSPGKPGSESISRASSLYSGISSGTLDEIKSIDLHGSYGTKIDTLARHIIWLREHDAGAKSIVFSQYREFLDVLSAAFKQFGIVFSRMGDAKAIDRFKQDASIEVFLLDAKTDSSGLNLTNAQYVFLVEPLINTAIELQAIARVHRIGQQRSTTVYMYLIGDTVEEAIYDISVTRRLAHMQKSGVNSRSGKSRSATPMLGEAAIDAANSLEMQQAPLSQLLVKAKGGGEVVAKNDLWGCLFGKANTAGTVVSDELQMELGRHLRAEAADERRQ